MERSPLKSRALALGALALLAQASAGRAAASPEPMKVPGGIAAVVRLLGPVDADPARFAASLDRVLLQAVRDDHAWAEVRERRELDELLELVQAVGQRFGQAPVFSSTTREDLQRFFDFASLAGYVPGDEPEPLDLAPMPTPLGARRRRAALALGWDIPALARGLRSGGRGSLAIAVDEVAPPVAWEQWQAITGREVHGTGALQALVRDQQLGLVLEGLRRLPPGAEAVLSTEDLAWIYREAALPFYRYGWSFDVRNGAVQLPGGADAAAAWTALVGLPPEAPAPFFRQLLTAEGHRVAFLWEALAMAPPARARYVLGLDRELHDGPAFARGVVQGLRRFDRRERFGGARGLGGGASDFLRMFTPPAPGHELELPGGIVVERVLRGADLVQLARALGSGPMATHPGLVGDDTAELVAWLGEAAPAAVATGARFRLRSAETFAAYLEALEALQRPDDPDRAGLALAFQGGIEILANIDRSGTLPADAIDEELRAWSRLHADARDPGAAVTAEFDWLERLVDGLPDPPAGFPGRGPRERRLFAALAGAGSERFEWAGLQYEGTRGNDRAGWFARRLEQQRVASADQLAAVRAAVRELERGAADGGAALKERATRALQALRPLPTVTFDAPLPAPLAGQLAPSGRAELEQRLLRVMRADKKAARAAAHAFEDLDRLLAPDLRALLVAPAYLVAMGEADSVLFGEPNLVRRHWPFKFLDAVVRRDVRRDNGWTETTFVPAADCGFGARVAGPLSGVPEALAEFRFPCDGVAPAGALRDPEPAAGWYGEHVRTAWPAPAPPVSRFAAAAMDAGRELVARAASEVPSGGTHLDFVAARVPGGRLKSAPPLVSRSEMFALGLAALAGDDLGPARPELLPAEALARLERARAGLGDGWRSALDVLGGETLAIDGRALPWVGRWPPYELLASGAAPAALREREWIELKLAIADYLGRRDLPGMVGADLLLRQLHRLACGMPQEHRGDWEGFVRWTTALAETALDEDLRACLVDGLYRARP
ncbi:MAG: hypothetical protein KBD01_10025 [Acidobacteria bacterium]|nr:hypothetical protein [Acidobacteriota bacterium]